MATMTMVAAAMTATAKAADHTTVVTGRAGLVGGERFCALRGRREPYCRLARQGPHPNPTPQPQLVPLNEVLPYAGIPLATSDPPPWDATAVLSQPSVVTHRPPIKS